MLPTAVLPYLWMLLGATAFAVMSILTALLKDEVDWQWIAIARAGLAMCFAATMAIMAGKRLVFLRPGKLWMRSIAGSISLVCGFYAMTHYQVSEVLTLTNMFPLWVAVLSLPLLGEWPSRDIWPAILIGLLGVALIQQPQVDAAMLNASNIAVAAAIVSSFTSAVALIGLHHVREIDPRAVVAHFSGVALVSCVLCLFVFPTNHEWIFHWRTVGVLLAVGICATVGQIFLTLAFAHGPPARVSVVGLSQVGLVMLMEMAFMGRSFSLTTLIGIALVVAPTAWSLIRSASRHKPEEVALELREAA